jgi:hypothetical protein
MSSGVNMSNVVDSVVRRLGRRTAGVVLVGVLVLLAGVVSAAYVLADSSSQRSGFPHSSALEQQLGVRFSRVAVVGDGGLITLDYVILDTEKAARFQSDVPHRPVLRSEARNGSTRRVAIMKQGHSLRAGQTYYFVYQNTHGALRSGEHVTILDGRLRLEHVPVL